MGKEFFFYPYQDQLWGSPIKLQNSFILSGIITFTHWQKYECKSKSICKVLISSTTSSTAECMQNHEHEISLLLQ
jgi:hypothetical protein